MKQSQNQNVFSTFFTVTKSIFYSRLGLFTVRVTTDLPSLLFILSLKKLFIRTIYNILRILGVFYKDRVWVCSFPGQTNMSETTESVISSRENRKTLLDRHKISNLTEASITKRFDWNFEVDYFSISHVELDARMFEKWMASFSRTGPTSQRCPKFPEHFHLRKAFHLYLDQDFRKVLHNGNRFETRVFSQRCGVLWMVGWVGSVPNCWARGGGFETWIDCQPESKKTARLQNTRPTKYLT